MSATEEQNESKTKRKGAFDGGSLIAPLDSEIERLRSTPSGSPDFRLLLDELVKLERFCEAEAEGARQVAKAAGVIEMLSEYGAKSLPRTSESAHETGVGFSAATHIASEWELAAQDARNLRQRLDALKHADRREQIEMMDQFRKFAITFFDEASKKMEARRKSRPEKGKE